MVNQELSILGCIMALMPKQLYEADPGVTCAGVLLMFCQTPADGQHKIAVTDRLRDLLTKGFLPAAIALGDPSVSDDFSIYLTAHLSEWVSETIEREGDSIVRHALSATGRRVKDGSGK